MNILNKYKNNEIQLFRINNIIQKYTPREIIFRCKNILSIQDIFKIPRPSLAKMSKFLGKEKTEAILSLQLIELNEIIGVKNGLTENAIIQIAHIINSEFYYLTIPDIYLIFKRIKTGYYGELYENINMPKVMKWIRDYSDERFSLIEEISYNQHLSKKEEKMYHNDSISERNKNQLKRAFSQARIYQHQNNIK